MSLPQSPQELLTQLQAYAQDPPVELFKDEALRRDIYSAAQKLCLRVEEPAVAVQRLIVGASADQAVLNVAFDLGLLPYLAKDSSSKTFKEIDTHIDADSQLLHRVLRSLASMGIVSEVGNHSYALSHSGILFGDPAFVKASQDCHRLISTMFGAVPSFLAGIQHKNPTDRRNGPVNKAFDTPDVDLFDLIKAKFPESINSMGTFLGAMSKESAQPFDVYPVQTRLVDGIENRPDGYFWVDIGGGIGMYAAALQAAHPNLPGQCVVQEQDVMVAVAQSKGLDKNVKFMVHNFFDEQPIKGARAYYLRNIFHNWGDKESAQLLQRIREAMKPGYSRLLINDLVIPQQGASQWESTQDWLMMMGYCAHERSEQQWHDLLEPVGLRVNRIYRKAGSLAIIEAEVAV